MGGADAFLPVSVARCDEAFLAPQFAVYAVRRVIAADLDFDLAVTSAFADQVSVFVNGGTGLFVAGEKARVGGDPSGLSAGDLDGDGDRRSSLSRLG